MDDAIETLQTCLRLLDLVHRVGEMIREGKYWGALRVSSAVLSCWLSVNKLINSHWRICYTYNRLQSARHRSMRISSRPCRRFVHP